MELQRPCARSQKVEGAVVFLIRRTTVLGIYLIAEGLGHLGANLVGEREAAVQGSKWR